MMNYSSSARLAVHVLKAALDSAGMLWASRALYALVSESPADMILSRALADNDVWNPEKRMKFRQEMYRRIEVHGWMAMDWTASHGEWAYDFGGVIRGIEESANKESAPEVNEHHIANILYTYEALGNEGRPHYMSDQGIYVPIFRNSVDRL
ncbi:MAG TPA: hypothetical protein VMW65_10755, partial [Chloroflexota bacterium]|nr:hypothetical protein [Chloroflexota bacterium]